MPWLNIPSISDKEKSNDSLQGITADGSFMLSSLISDPASAAMQPLGSYTQPPAIKKSRRLWGRECFELCRQTNRTNRSRSPSLSDEGWILVTMAFHARQNSISSCNSVLFPFYPTWFRVNMKRNTSFAFHFRVYPKIQSKTKALLLSNREAPGTSVAKLPPFLKLVALC